MGQVSLHNTTRRSEPPENETFVLTGSSFCYSCHEIFDVGLGRQLVTLVIKNTQL